MNNVMMQVEKFSLAKWEFYGKIIYVRPFFQSGIEMVRSLRVVAVVFGQAASHIFTLNIIFLGGMSNGKQMGLHVQRRRHEHA